MKPSSSHPSTPEPSPPDAGHRLTGRDLLAQVVDELFRADPGLPWPLGQLLPRPGWLIRRYIEHRDGRATPPFRLALACLGVAALVLHLFGGLAEFGAGFADGVASGGPPGGPPPAMQSAGALVFGRFDLMLVLVWVPAVAAALRQAYPGLALNFAEAGVFGLYTLAITLLIFTPLSMLPHSGASWLGLVVALPLWTLGHAAFGLARPAGHGLIRAIGFALLAQLSALLLLLGILLLATTGFALLG